MSNLNQNSNTSNVAKVPSQQATTPTSLAKIHATLESTTIIINNVNTNVGTLISTFLSEPNNEFRWNYMDIGIKKFLENNRNQTIPIDGLRVLVSTSDGTVAYDSSRDEMTNTFSNYKTSSIGDNHMTRTEMLLALLGKDGLSVGISQRLSRTTSEPTSYFAERVGMSTSNPLGISRISTIIKNQ